MAKAARRYSEKTLKVLYGSSGNQCAHPDCTNPVIAPATSASDEAVLAQICHIYAASDRGPRGKPGLTEEERNAPENLILLCGHHHPLVDKQWKDYPADLLRSWKKAKEAKFNEGTAEAAKLQASMQQLAFVQALSDEQINRELEKIRKCRFLAGYSSKDAASVFASRVEAAELAGGSSEVRAEALAWCARFLSLSDVDRARALLEKSKALGACSQATIAEAFILSDTDKNAALALLAKSNAPAARSAALRIVTNHDTPAGAARWLEQTGLAIDDFDADGKLVYLMNALALANWQSASAAAETITEQDLQETPALCHPVALAALVQTVPDEFRESLLINAPFEADRFPLASDEAALIARRKAQSLFARVSAFAESMGLAAASNPASDFALWLKLRDPQDYEQGREELRESTRDPQRSLRRVNLALQFGIKLDVAALENEINRRVALSGKGSVDEAFARYALAFTQGGPRAAAEYIARHRDQLYEHLTKEAIQTTEIELLARGGLVQTARETLNTAVAEGLGDKEQRHLRRVIAEAEGADPATERKKLYEETKETRDLVNLISFLEEQGAWQEMAPYARELFTRTRSLEDSLRLAKALHESNLTAELFDFLSSHQELVEQSTSLKALWAWSLYREGRFADATAVLGILAAKQDDRNYRVLRVNIAIASGHWTDLIEFTNSEWEKRDERTPLELLGAGELAQTVNGPRARDLITAAAVRAPDDPHILAACYFHATKAGWEQSPETAGWLSRAAEISGEDGPIKSMSLNEVLERKPEWDRQESTALQQLNEGKMPSFGAAQALHRSLIDFILLPSLANLNEPDTRRRTVIYAYSGARPAVPLPAFDTLALDVTAIITLTRLGLLQKVVDTYQGTVIPHATLAWLLRERERATFHQPSRIKDAHFIRKLLSDKALNVLSPQLPRDNTLAREVGDDLATLLLAAKAKSGKEGAAIVVRSAPVHRVGSLTNEEADLSAHSGHLCSCTAVIDKLRARGLLTIQEEERARSYLKLHERPWPGEPAIADNAELYLDDLSVSYLMTVGVIDKLGRAGLTAYITERENREANQFIAHEALTDRQLEIIGTIQRTLAEGLKSGRIRAMRSESDEGEQETVLKTHPTFSLLELSGSVGALVVDDRFVNSHTVLQGRKQQTPVLTTLDLLDDLAAKGVITTADLFAHRTYLRQAVLQLIPIRQDELIHHLANTTIEADAIVETAELRAIREAWLRARMIKMVQIPGEVPLLQRCAGEIVQTIKRLWREKPDEKEAEIHSEWLAQLIDMRGWASCATPGNERGFALYVPVAQLAALASRLADVPRARQDAFTNWVEERFLKEVRERQPEAFRWMVDRARDMIADWVEDAMREPALSPPPQRSAAAIASLNQFPPIVREALLDDAKFVDEYRLTISAVLSVGASGVSFQRSDLLGSVGRALESATEATVADTDGGVWRIEVRREGDKTTVALVQDDRNLMGVQLALLSPDSEERLKSFRAEAYRVNLPFDVAQKAEVLLAARPPNADELVGLTGDLADTPTGKRGALDEAFRHGPVPFELLAPRSKRYYERLVGRHEDGQALNDYTSQVAAPHMRALVEQEPFKGYLLALLVSASQPLGIVLSSVAIDDAALVRVYDWLVDHGDMLSRAAAVEAGLLRRARHGPVREALARLIHTIIAPPTVGTVEPYELLSALFILVYGEMAYTRTLASKPPYWRRLAALAHAALIARVVIAGETDVSRFVKWAMDAKAHSFLLQCYCDMRMEPRWIPDFALPRPIKHELAGRVFHAASGTEEDVVAAGWKGLLLDDVSGGLRNQLDIRQAFVPGPLEGSTTTLLEIPEENLAEMRADLKRPVITASSFSALANSAILFRIPGDLCDLAAEAIVRADYHFANVDQTTPLIPHLLGLATAAAATRNEKLADALFIVVRKYRRLYPDALNVENAFRTIMHASASRADLNDWCKCVGSALTDLSFQDIAENDAVSLHAHIVQLCELVPELWATCGQAEAALRSVLNA